MVNMQMLEEAALAMTMCDPDKPVDDGTGRLSMFKAMDAQESLHRLLVTDDDWGMFREKFPEAAAIYDKTKDRFRSMFRAFTQE
jgi:hypothetical protein